jgi:hypothetical protein
MRYIASMSAIAFEFVGIAWFWAVPAFGKNVTSDAGFAHYERMGQYGLLLAYLALAASLFGRGRVRLLSSAAAIGILCLWATLGFYPLP